MSELEQHLKFEASAYLQRLLGRELISTAELAIVELVKNAYDAGACRVLITVCPQSLKEPGEITIRDDGEGMSLEALKQSFMTAGYSDRPDQIESAVRVPTGEKGIGRFAADKLGHELVVATMTEAADRAIQVSINWDSFEDRRKYFNDISVPYSYAISRELSQVKSGTLLRITRLREKWDAKRIKQLRKALSALIDPFNAPADFTIDLHVPSSNKFSDSVTPLSVANADIELKFRIEKSGRLKRRLRAPTLGVDRDEKDMGTSAAPEHIAGLTGRFLYFLRRPKKEQTKGLDAAVRLYRDGFRVEPFGRAADWLGVAERKAKRAGHAHVVPSHLFGFVSISMRDNPALRHTTSRETLIEGEEMKSMMTFLREQLAFLEDHIRHEISEPRWKESSSRRAVEQERLRFQTLSIMSIGLAHELRQPLQAIRSEADNIRTRLQQMNVDDLDIREAQKSIDDNVARIDKNIQAIAKISSGNVDDITEMDLAKFVLEQTELMKPRCTAGGISLHLELPKIQKAQLNVVMMTTVLWNLVQNAIDEFREYNNHKDRQITVGLSKRDNFNILEVTDNGPGIDDDVRANLFKEFVTKKTGGLGVGLYYCRQLLKMHGGSIGFTSRASVGTTFRAECPDQDRSR